VRRVAEDGPAARHPAGYGVMAAAALLVRACGGRSWKAARVPWSLVRRSRDLHAGHPGSQLMSCRADRAIPTTASTPAQAIKVIAPAPGDRR
jgi:hypothetical protein